jgi:cellulose synthase/poly-beta-1,6-N-acetylglucosamine synthase-like glycosyltransferase
MGVNVSRTLAAHRPDNNGASKWFTVLVGIPAYNEEKHIEKCLDSVLSQRTQVSKITGVVVVTSGCTDATTRLVQEEMRKDDRIELVAQPTRLGKAQALNEILNVFAKSDSDYLVVVSADACPRSDAIEALVKHAAAKNAVFVAGSPVPNASYPAKSTYKVVEFMWSLHNSFIRANSQLPLVHLTDELMCIKKRSINRVPIFVVNDGAYFSLNAFFTGNRADYCRKAVVEVAVPKNLRELVKQRSRILLGHLRLKVEFGVTTKTFETSFLRSPFDSLRILSQVLKEKRGPTTLMRAACVEALSAAVALLRYFSDKQPWIWEKVDTY